MRRMMMENNAGGAGVKCIKKRKRNARISVGNGRPLVCMEPTGYTLCWSSSVRLLLLLKAQCEESGYVLWQ